MTRLVSVVFVVELVASMVLIVGCVAAYQHTTGGAWRDSQEGRHLMAFMGALALVLVMSVLRVVALGGPPDLDSALWSAVVRDVVYVPVPLVFGWRLRIILAAGRARRTGGEHV